MGRLIAFLYGLIAYLAFFVTILYAIGFVTGLPVPKTIDTGAVGSTGDAFIVNLLLMSLFAIQHSVMARKGFKQWWTQFVPKTVERSTYVLFASTFMINHFELFGLHQVANNLVGREMPGMRFKTPVLYKFVRHPIYLGFIIASWAAPTMTVGHLLFAAVITAYIFVGIFLEERDLVELFGDEYSRYRERVAMLVPWRKSA